MHFAHGMLNLSIRTECTFITEVFLCKHYKIVHLKIISLNAYILCIGWSLIWSPDDDWLACFRRTQLRVGQSLQRVNPVHHYRRRTRTHRPTNPVSYRSDYFGEKLHVNQNEKLVMFGVTHVCATGGHSRRIAGFATMLIKNYMNLYTCEFNTINLP